MAVTRYYNKTLSSIPVGTIIPWIGGYFGDGSNGTFTNVLANTIENVNTLLNSDGWYVCNGAALNDVLSPIFNGSGRYLPNLTDERFLQGNTTAGGIGGSNTLVDHTHTHSLTVAAHTHTFSGTSSGHSVDHAHYTSGTTSSSGSHNHAQAYDYQWTGRYGSVATGSATARSEQGGAFSGTDAALTSTSGAHTHTFGAWSGGVNTDHTHTYSGTTSGASASSISGTVGAGSVATSTNARPKYLSVFYIIKVK
jgi:hypothetical protein